MKTTLVMATLAALLVTAGLAAAQAPQDPYDHKVTVLFLGTYYIICGPPPEVWEETNGTPGLQKSPWTDERGNVHPADTPVLIFEGGGDIVGKLIAKYCKQLP